MRQQDRARPLTAERCEQRRRQDVGPGSTRTSSTCQQPITRCVTEMHDVDQAHRRRTLTIVFVLLGLQSREHRGHVGPRAFLRLGLGLHRFG